MESRHVRISLALLIVLFAGCIWGLLYSGAFFWTYEANAPNREALLRIRNAVSLGDHADAVRQAYVQNATPHLRLKEVDANRWLIEMPPEFQPGSWALWIEFADARVSAVRIRTGDGPASRDAPPDQVADLQ